MTYPFRARGHLHLGKAVAFPTFLTQRAGGSQHHCEKGNSVTRYPWTAEPISRKIDTVSYRAKKLALIAVVLVVTALAALHPEVQYRADLVNRKLRGEPPEITWTELALRMIPGSQLRLRIRRFTDLSSPFPTAAPESKGFNRARLEAARDILVSRNTQNLLVIRQGYMVYEWYAEGRGPGGRHHIASGTKALVGGMSLLLALNDGLIAIDDPASQYIPAWGGDPQKSKITIRHLATHSSGIEQPNVPSKDLPGWIGAFWRRDADPFQPVIHDAPVVFKPGSDFAYSSPGMAALAYAVTASLQGTPHEDLRTLLRERIMRPIGVADEEWSIGYGETYNADGLPLVPNWGGGNFTPRAVARVGQLMLQRGNWEGRQLVQPDWVDRITAYAGTPLPPRSPGNPAPSMGLGWWTNHDGVWPKVPRDAFMAAGAGQQVLLVVPSLDLIVVRNGREMSDPAEPEGFWRDIEKYLFNPVVAALTSNSS